MDCLILQTIAHLKTQLALDATNCGEMIDGRPPPFAGQFFYSVDESQWENASDLSLDERLGVAITITLRADATPADRMTTPLQELRRRARQVRVAVHMNYDLLNLVNAAINTEAGQTENGLVEPLKFMDGGRPMIRGPDWFWAEGEDQAITGISRTLIFRDALRVQTIESME